MNLQTGIKIKKEDFKSLKDEIKNIKGNINEEMYNIGVFMNDKEEYVWRANKRRHFEKSIPEKHYDLNEILKYYELNKDKYLQGFTSNYFQKLSDLMIKHKYKQYSKERLDLFNSRINQSQKIYIKHLRKNGKDSELKSSINRKIRNPFVTFLHPYKNNHNHNHNQNVKVQIRNKNNNKHLKIKNNLLYNNISNQKHPSSTSNITTLTYNDFNRKLVKIKINNKEEVLSYNSTYREGTNNSNINNNKKKLLKNLSYGSIRETKNNKDTTNTNNITFPHQIKNSNNSTDNSVIIDGKEEFLKNLDKDKYFKYLKSQYNFFDDHNIDKNHLNFEKKTIERRILFKLKPNNKFLEKRNKDGCKADFFYRIKREIDNGNTSIKQLNNTNNQISKRKIGDLPSLSARSLKTMKFNNDFHSIFEKVKKNLNNEC